VNILAVIFGGAVGVLLRLLLDRQDSPRNRRLRWNTLIATGVGASLLGVATGAVLQVTQPGQFRGLIGSILSSTLFAFCVFCNPVLRLLRERDGQQGLLPAAAHTFAGFAIATMGVLLGMWANSS
jgi:fluoride ion exporter CrcB/FEX